MATAGQITGDHRNNRLFKTAVEISAGRRFAVRKSE
jgi:hypothetical protein